MADTLKILAQSNPAAFVLTDIYTVAALTSVAVSSIIVCNLDNKTVKVRISLAVAGAADTTKQYLYYDVEILTGNTFIATIGVTLAAADVVRVYTNSTSTTFQFFGVEVT